MQLSSTSNGRFNTASSSTSPLVGERGHGDEVQVLEVNFSAVAQRRLARHARHHCMQLSAVADSDSRHTTPLTGLIEHVAFR